MIEQIVKNALLLLEQGILATHMTKLKSEGVIKQS